jgi:hypothetical protein
MAGLDLLTGQVHACSEERHARVLAVQPQGNLASNDDTEIVKYNSTKQNSIALHLLWRRNALSILGAGSRRNFSCS